MTIPPAASLHDPAESFYSRWQALNDWLVRHRPLWQQAPFTEPVPEWTLQHPELAARVAGLDDERCRVLDDDPARLAGLLCDALPSLAAYPDLVSLPDLSPPGGRVHRATLPEVRAVDMPGRKRLQSGAFAAALEPLREPVMDWCCGKGHLSRTLAAVCPEPVRGYEWNAELVRDGNRLAAQFDDAVAVQCQDVMAPDFVFPTDAHGVALHACGDLHRQLIRRASEVRLPRLSFSPCCYHLTDASPYRLLSARARRHDAALQLSRNEIRLAVQETVTAPARVQEQTRKVSQWRLGFDALQRQLRSCDEYLPVPSHPSRLIQEGFEAFCQWAARKKGLVLPATTDFEHWSRVGDRRYSQVRRHELVRHLFRRPLELWMVLDYAIFLEEQGYRVRLGAFCDRTLTPRNLLLDAVRVSGTPPVVRSRP
ncbi:methyltransferase [Marinobacter sp. F4218]|uniref:methyltransferase n=1 Tax=Marinobacter sp. F4218 TaxID=2862868 RepID=UPI001C63718B|nr:methyltransferase [Marinobacter sp. F4218]MBW7471450.1 SAM-dependent methyltransferase [Marinobacter sp. F4218]